MESFNKVFETLKFTSKFEPKQWTTKKLLTLAEKSYKELRVDEKWTGISTNPSALRVGSPGGGRRIGPFYRCGGAHMKRDFPRGQGGGNRGGRHRETNPLRPPPGKVKPHVKQIDGKPMKWCGRCNFWNPSHETSEHVPNFNRKKDAAHVAALPLTADGKPAPAELSAGGGETKEAKDLVEDGGVVEDGAKLPGAQKQQAGKAAVKSATANKPAPAVKLAEALAPKPDTEDSGQVVYMSLFKTAVNKAAASAAAARDAAGRHI